MRKRPSARFLVKYASLSVTNGIVNREVWLVALDDEGRMGPELRLTCLDDDTYRYFADHVLSPVTLTARRDKAK